MLDNKADQRATLEDPRARSDVLAIVREESFLASTLRRRISLVSRYTLQLDQDSIASSARFLARRFIKVQIRDFGQASQNSETFG